jgi:uncharacterized membrane protein SirB2
MDWSSLYPLLKLIHISTVIITGSLFLLRFVWMLQDRLPEKAPWVYTLPHYNDTLLFLSGLSMAAIIGQLPMVAPWLTSKLFILLAYILLGTLALRRGRRRWIRIYAGIAALGCYLYIITIALTRDPTPTLADLFTGLGLS